ncbi:MAG: FtsX-like permease family protein [Acidobacteriaceae bacterium]|nr:FtsX-like permease family protein [Acidobacteriaceae bacterium]
MQGRAFTEADTEKSRPVAIISHTMAHRYFPGENLIGRRIRQGGPERGNAWREIVGVAGDVKYMGLGAPDVPVYYEPETQNTSNGMFLSIRSTLQPKTVLTDVRHIVDRFDKDLALDHQRTMNELLSHSVSLPRSRATLLTIMAALALSLAAIGIYGVVTFTVNQRRSEIAVRKALGAQPRVLLWLVIRQSMQPVVCGVLVGATIAAVLGRAMESVLFGIHSRDPLTFAIATGVLFLIALLACCIPAIRSGAIDPAATLRAE